MRSAYRSKEDTVTHSQFRRLGILFATCLAMVLVLGSVAIAGADTGFLTIVLQGDIITLDPAHMLDTQSSHVGEQMYESLLANDIYGIPGPALATSWEWNDEGTEVTFYLRQGVKFHDGTDFDAHDIKFNFDRVMDEAVACYNRETPVSYTHLTLPTN